MPSTRVADLTVDEFKVLIRETVKQTLMEMVNDPDEGLQLREEMKAALQRSVHETEAGAETIPAERVAAKLGLEW